MIISNPSQTNAELDRKAIITMGDTLHNRGDLFAAQFCYLMAKVEFSRYSDVKHDSSMILNHTVNAGRLILLGTSCYKSSFADFATDEAIIMTEIYEYACSLPNSQFSIVEFQPYKYLLGTRMLDYGFHLKSLLYMEQVARHIQMNPAQYNHIFIEKVHNLADKLKYYDPVLEKNVDSLNDEDITSQINGQLQWQADLVNLLAQNDVSNFVFSLSFKFKLFYIIYLAGFATFNNIYRKYCSNNPYGSIFTTDCESSSRNEYYKPNRSRVFAN